MTRSEQARRRRAYRGRGGRRAAPEQQMPVRLIVCGAVFVVLVAVKLLFPGAIGGLARSVGDLLGRNADFRAAFAAIGRAVSGEQDVGDSLQDAYVAVFDPASRPDGQPDRTAAGGGVLVPGERLLRFTASTLPEPDPDRVRETVLDAGALPEQADASAASLSWSYTFRPLPDNASMEQRNLGFEHCTPVLGKMNSGFGWREHPVTGGDKFHYGVDLGAAEGTDILAFAGGEVYATGESSTLGNYIMLRHEGGYVTLYGHCSRVVVTSGEVEMGQKIAEVGATGQVTGPHLHFELHDGDLYLNPIYYVQVA